MFNHIAPRYDFLNHFLSLGIDRIWRKKMVKILAKASPKQMLDVAAGTGDLSIQAVKEIPDLNVLAVDIAAVMLEHAEKKIKKKNLTSRIKTAIADAEDLKYENNKFDAVTAAFGVRNFEDVHKGLTEMNRVLKKNGELFILEFSKPRAGLFALIFRLYFRFVLPFLGRLFSRNNRAYNYLPESVEAFPEREEFIELLQKAGFHSCFYKSLTFGIACMYYGKK